jgi:hypothetical protein
MKQVLTGQADGDVLVLHAQLPAVRHERRRRLVQLGGISQALEDGAQGRGVDAMRAAHGQLDMARQLQGWKW